MLEDGLRWAAEQKSPYDGKELARKVSDFAKRDTAKPKAADFNGTPKVATITIDELPDGPVMTANPYGPPSHGISKSSAFGSSSFGPFG